jgi:hypothetical protein
MLALVAPATGTDPQLCPKTPHELLGFSAASESFRYRPTARMQSGACVSGDNFGRLSCEIRRACCLVIDMGIHHYIAWPGQAFAYRLGEILIRQKRAEAEAKLGTHFDPRNSTTRSWHRAQFR